MDTRRPEVVPHRTFVAPKAAGLKRDKPEPGATEPDLGSNRTLSRLRPAASSATLRNPPRQSRIWARSLGFAGLFFLVVF